MPHQLKIKSQLKRKRKKKERLIRKINVCASIYTKKKKKKYSLYLFIVCNWQIPEHTQVTKLREIKEFQRGQVYSSGKFKLCLSHLQIYLNQNFSLAA